MKSRLEFLIFVISSSAIVHVAGCAPTAERQPPPIAAKPAQDPSGEARAQALAAEAAAKSTKTERAEGKQNLVKDDVKVKTDAQGRPVVEQTGEASWYGRYHHGRKTATGERFDQNELTAAHPTLPLGTEATITNLDNGKTVRVIINDRGPYAKGRDIDLSRAAARQLGVTEDGAAPVRIDAVVTPKPEQTVKR
jgi:rare lipoprotein A